MFSSYISSNSFLIFFIIPCSSACSSYVDPLSLAHFPSHSPWVVSSELSNWSHGFYNHLLQTDNSQVVFISSSWQLLQAPYSRMCLHFPKASQKQHCPEWFHHCLPVPQTPPPAVFHVSVIDTITYLVTQARNGQPRSTFPLLHSPRDITIQTYLESVLLSLI